MIESLAPSSVPDRIEVNSARPEILEELDRFRALPEDEIDRQIAGGAAAGVDGFLEMVGHRGAFAVRWELDMDREALLAEDRLVGTGHRDEIVEVDAVAARRRAALRGDDDVEPRAQRAAGENRI